jgi:hypothetical protein
MISPALFYVWPTREVSRVLLNSYREMTFTKVAVAIRQISPTVQTTVTVTVAPIHGSLPALRKPTAANVSP